MNKILIIGGVSYNTIIYLDEFPDKKPHTVFSKQFHETIGETGAGKALNLNKLGFETLFYGLIGNDLYSEKIIDFFKNQNLNFVYDYDTKGTERHINLMDNAGQRISIYLCHSSPQIPQIKELIKQEIDKCNYLVINIQNYSRAFIPLAKQYNKEIWCDIHDYDGKNPHHDEFIKNSDYIFLSSDNMVDYMTFMEKLISQGKKLVVCTHGKDGSTALTHDGKWIKTPIIKEYDLAKKDTNGAGDAFFAGFIYGHSKKFNIDKCLKIATIVSGLCISSNELFYDNLSEEIVMNEYFKYNESR